MTRPDDKAVEQAFGTCRSYAPYSTGLIEDALRSARQEIEDLARTIQDQAVIISNLRKRIAECGRCDRRAGR